MDNSEVTGIETLLQSRESKEGVIGGEYIAFIGLLMTATYLFNAFVYSHFAVWFASITFGWIAIVGHEKIQEQKAGHYATRIQKEVLSIWAIIGGFAIPTVLIFLPAFFDLYSGRATVPLIYLILGIGTWLTGAVSQSSVFKGGGISYFIALFLSPLIPSSMNQLILFVIVMFLGLILPGIVSKINE